MNSPLSLSHLITLYQTSPKEVRSVLELVVPVWHSGITRLQAGDIERIQKISFKIKLGVRYNGYKSACTLFSAQTLEERRIKLCIKFAFKNLKSENCLFGKLEQMQTPDKKVM